MRAFAKRAEIEAEVRHQRAGTNAVTLLGAGGKTAHHVDARPDAAAVRRRNPDRQVILNLARNGPKPRRREGGGLRIARNASQREIGLAISDNPGLRRSEKI
jgi:hypothetical protein